MRQAESLCVVESLAVLQSALASRAARVDDLFVSDDVMHEAVVQQAAAASARVWRVASQTQLRTDVSESPPLAAIVRLDADLFGSDAFDVFATQRPRATVAVLLDVQNPTNVGALLRSAAAFDAGVIVAGQTADVLNSKCVRASAGALFALRCVWREREPLRVIERLRAAHFDIVGTVASAAQATSTDLAALQAAPRVAFLLGSEAHGLDARALAQTVQRVRIATQADVESLNVAVAGSLLLHKRFESTQR